MSEENYQALRRRLQNRHLQMIALGGAIGTGLFYGSAETIALTGPSVILSYLLGGVVIFFIMRMLGEMAVDEPVSGSFSYYAGKYWGAFPSFLSGWNYWFNYVIVSMAELTAVGIHMHFWLPDAPQWLSALPHSHHRAQPPQCPRLWRDGILDGAYQGQRDFRYDYSRRLALTEPPRTVSE